MSRTVPGWSWRGGPSRRCGPGGCAPRAGFSRIGPARPVAHPRGGGRTAAEAGVVLGADEVTELHRRTEGWPTGLYLAALYLREGGSLPGGGGLRRGRPAGERVRGIGVPGPGTKQPMPPPVLLCFVQHLYRSSFVPKNVEIFLIFAAWLEVKSLLSSSRSIFQATLSYSAGSLICPPEVY